MPIHEALLADNALDNGHVGLCHDNKDGGLRREVPLVVELQVAVGAVVGRSFHRHQDLPDANVDPAVAAPFQGSGVLDAEILAQRNLAQHPQIAATK